MQRQFPSRHLEVLDDEDDRALLHRPIHRYSVCTFRTMSREEYTNSGIIEFDITLAMRIRQHSSDTRVEELTRDDRQQVEPT